MYNRKPYAVKMEPRTKGNMIKQGKYRQDQESHIMKHAKDKSRVGIRNSRSFSFFVWLVIGT